MVFSFQGVRVKTHLPQERSQAHFLPETKGCFKGSWRLYGAWQRIELPARAPPFPELVLNGLAGHAVATGQYALAICLMLGFHCVLRTGEVLSANISQLTLTNSTGVLQLENTKSGQRTGALEAVTIQNSNLVLWLQMWVAVRRKQAGKCAKLWPDTPAAFRKAFAVLLRQFELDEFGFKPYSMRRGGATAFFTKTGSMELTLSRGRWGSAKVARLYLNDGLAALADISLTKTQLRALKAAARQLV